MCRSVLQGEYRVSTLFSSERTQRNIFCSSGDVGEVGELLTRFFCKNTTQDNEFLMPQVVSIAVEQATMRNPGAGVHQCQAVDC